MPITSSKWRWRTRSRTASRPRIAVGIYSRSGGGSWRSGVASARPARQMRLLLRWGAEHDRAREAIRRVLKGAPRSLSKEGNWIWVRNHMRAASLERLIEVARNGEPAERPHAIEVLRERARL